MSERTKELVEQYPNVMPDPAVREVVARAIDYTVFHPPEPGQNATHPSQELMGRFLRFEGDQAILEIPDGPKQTKEVSYPKDEIFTGKSAVHFARNYPFTGNEENLITLVI